MDPSGDKPNFRTETDDLLDRLLAQPLAQLQYILWNVTKRRDDLLFYVAFTKEVFTMSSEEFKHFKEYLLYHNIVDIPALLKDAQAQAEAKPVE